MSKYDVIVIGGGPGGYVAAIRAAQLGAKVALIERDQVGGTCLNRGCIPTKTILASISLFEKMKKASNYGITASNVSIDYKQVIERKNTIVAKLVKGVEFLLKKNKVTLIKGAGKVVSPGKVEVQELGTQNSELKTPCSVLSAQNIILATGSSPISLPGIEFDGKKYFNSEQMLNNPEVPAKLNIVGGGVIGLEFAQIYSALGTEVTIYEALPEILSGIDSEIVQQLKRILKRKKVNILTNTKFDPKVNDHPTLICIGRKPNEQKIPEGVIAIGDITSKKQLAHVAYEQGVIAAENVMGKDRSFSDEFIPYGIFTSPEIAGIGATDGPKIGKFPFAALGIAQAKGEIEGFIKVVSDEAGKLLGVHIIGPDATNLIGAAVVAIKNGLSVEQLAETFQAHPSFPEGLQEASLASLKRAVHGG